MFEILGEAGKQGHFTTNAPKILDLKSSSEQILSENCRWVPLLVACEDRPFVPETIFRRSIRLEKTDRMCCLLDSFRRT